MFKESIAVFNPQEPLERVVQEVYHKCADRFLTAGEVRSFIESIIACEGLFEQFLSTPMQVCTTIFNVKDDSDSLYIPCYALELRDILRRKKIVSPYRLAAFKSVPAKRLLSEYPILLVLSEKKLHSNEKDSLNGIVILDSELSINGALLRVLVRERADSQCAQSVDRIVSEEYPDATVHSLTEPPGLSMKAAAAEFNKYVINISRLGITDHIVKAQSPDDALEEALQRAWAQSGNPHRGPEYTVDYWKNSGFMPAIIREASDGLAALKFMLPPKTSQKWYEHMKDIGEKSNTVDWLCGNVKREDFKIGTDIEKNVIVLDTGVEKLKLKRANVEKHDDTALAKLIGKGICAKGTKDAYVFTMSEFKLVNTERDNETVYMERSMPDDVTTFTVGDKVRRRKRGISFPQIDGEVSRIHNGLMYVKWRGVTNAEVFRLNDTINLSLMLEKI